MKKEEKMTEGKKFDFYPHSPIIIDENSDDSIEILYQSTKTSHSIDEFQTFNNEFDKKNKKKSIVMIDRTQNVTEEDFEKEKVHKSTQTYFFDYINFRSNSRIQSPKKLNQTSISLDKDISPDRYRSCRVPKLSFRKSENLNVSDPGPIIDIDENLSEQNRSFQEQEDISNLSKRFLESTKRMKMNY